MIKKIFKKIHRFLCYKKYIDKQTEIIYKQISQIDETYDI